MKSRLNASMIQIALRWFQEGFENCDVSDVRQKMPAASDVVWLSTTAVNQKALDALNGLPVSIYRVYYETLKVGRAHLCDEQFNSLGNKLFMFMEATHFSRINGFNPLICIGMDDVAFRIFESGAFEERMHMIRRGGFRMGTRCRLQSLRMNPASPEDQIWDTTVVLTGELRHFLKTDTAPIGLVKDFTSVIPSHRIAEEMLLGKIQPKLVAAYTGLSESTVNGLKRSLLRSVPTVQSQSGRIQLPNKVLAEKTIHCLLFLTIYRLLADAPLMRTNARAVLAANAEYRKICQALDVPERLMISPSNGYQLSNALKSGDITLSPCPKCHEIIARYILKPSRCIWCGK